MGHAKSRLVEDADKSASGRLGKRNYRSTVPFRASSSFLSRLIGMKRRDLVGAVSNCAYSVRAKTAPTGRRKCLYIFRIHHNIATAERYVYRRAMRPLFALQRSAMCMKSSLTKAPVALNPDLWGRHVCRKFDYC